MGLCDYLCDWLHTGDAQVAYSAKCKGLFYLNMILEERLASVRPPYLFATN
jgi:hypothetical protein